MRLRPSAIVLWLSLSTVAQAADMENYDLASLCYLSKEIVLAEEVSHQTRLISWNETTTYKITKVYQGSLSVGKEIEVYDDAYRLDIGAPYQRDAAGVWKLGTAPAREKRVMLFLSMADDWKPLPDKPALTGLYRKTPSGIRLFADGKTYRVEQHSNPGPYEPVPQGLDYLDDRGLQRRKDTINIEPITFEELEKALGLAMTKAKSATKAIAITDASARNKALLALLPSPRSFPVPFKYSSFDRFEDRLSMSLQEEIGSKKHPKMIESKEQEVSLEL